MLCDRTEKSMAIENRGRWDQPNLEWMGRSYQLDGVVRAGRFRARPKSSVNAGLSRP